MALTEKTIRTPRRILPVLFLGVLMAALDLAIIGPVLPAVGEGFGVGERALAWVFSVFVLFNLVGVPLMARLSDVWGRRRVYLAAVALFGAGSLVAALAPSFAVLLGGMGMQGVAASGIFPVASAVIGDLFAPERRGRMLGVLGSVFGVAFIVGPILAGLLLRFGWPWVFAVNVAMAVFVGALGYRVLPATRPEAARPLDARGIVTLGTLLAALAFGINQIDTEALYASFTSLRVWPFLMLAVLLLPLFVYLERRTAEPVVRLGLFRNRQVVLAGLLAFGAGLTEAAFIFFPLLAVAAFDVTKSTAAYMLLPLTVAVAVGAPVAGRVLDRVGSRAIVVGGSACLAVGLGLVGLFPDERLFFYGGSVFIGLGMAALLGSALSYIVLNASRAEERTVAQGIITLFISIGQLVGAPLIGAVVASGDGGLAGYAGAFLAIAAVALVLTVLAFGLKKRASELQAAHHEDPSS